MAHSIGISDRLEDARFRAPSTSTSSDESSFSFYKPPLRANVNRLSAQTPVTSDARALLPRRFTTQGVATLSSLSPIGQLRRQPAEPPSQDMPFSIVRKTQLLEKRQAECDFLKQKALQFQHEMERITMQVQMEEEEVHRLRHDLGSFHPGAGHQSEPTTPPEYIELGFPTPLSRPNRFSASGIMSPPGLINRPSRAASQVTSPPVERARAYEALTSGAPSQSVPGSRRDSDDDEEDNYDSTVMSFNLRNAASRNRNSMPITRRDHVVRNGIVDFEPVQGQVDTPGYLFGGDFKANTDSKPSSRPVSGYLSMQKNIDNFPVLIRGQVDQLDATATQIHDHESNQGGWPTSFARPNTSQGTMTRPISSGRSAEDSPPHGHSQSGSTGLVTPPKATAVNRNSMGASMNFTETQRPSPLNGTPGATNLSRLPTKLQTSFSTSSVPTVSSLAGLNGSSVSSQVQPMSSGGLIGSIPGTQIQSLTTAEQRLHNHNVSLGRIPTGAVNSNRQSRDISTLQGVDMPRNEGHNNILQSQQSGLQANAPSFGSSSVSQGSANNSSIMNSMSNSVAHLSNQGYGTGYSMNTNANQLSDSMQALTVSQTNPSQWNAQMQGYQQAYQQGFQQAYASYPPGSSYGISRTTDNQSRVLQQRRNQVSSDENARFANIALESLIGEIYGLCKDQHGCRYLQKKLENGNPEHVMLIFAETHQHMVELMTDPFGNYLCQKLFEFTEDEQRTALINNAATHMVKIALNQHGTRALQKMIEFVSIPEQVQTVIYALRHHVVLMIQDLNGNHVIQKCLNRLSSADAQFIFDAVSGNIMAVGTHRHGCCVIQRCIDHASGAQKAQLCGAVTACSIALVQDPYGNYVAQYVLDQGDESLVHPLCRTFLGQTSALSKQKFSSNVIEKAIRVADVDTRHRMIQELIDDFDRLTEDPYANYVVQTAWDYSENEDKIILAERLRPILARMRNKPYARKLQGKMVEHDKEMEERQNNPISPLGNGPGTASYTSALLNSTLPRRMSNNSDAFQQHSGNGYNGVSYNGNSMSVYAISATPGFPAPRTHGFNNGTPPAMGQYQGQGQGAQGPQGPQGPQYPVHGQFNPQHGMGYF